MRGFENRFESLQQLINQDAELRTTVIDSRAGEGAQHAFRPRGQFIGRAETVQGGASGAEYEINWRVERIRESDIVLVRDDPTNPDVPSATRIIPLRPETADDTQASLQ